MSDKDKVKGSTASASKTNDGDAPKPATLSIAPAMDLSLDAVTVPPPPTSGPSSGAPFSIPRAPRMPTESKQSAPAKRKRSEDDIFSIFDVEANTASDDIPVSVQQFDKPPAAPPEKPKSQLGNKMEEREVTRSRQIPLDDDLFNLSVGLFSSPEKSTLVAPDMSALVSPGLSEKSEVKPSASLLDELVIPPLAATPLAPVESQDLLTAKAPPLEKARPTSAKSHRGILLGGIAVAALAVGGVFFFMQRSSPTEPTAAVEQPKTSNENALDTRPGQTAEVSTVGVRVPKPEAADKPAPTAGATEAPKEGSDKPATIAAVDKPATTDKGTTATAPGKTAEPEPAKTAEADKAATAAKSLSLAEAMAAAAPGGGGAPPPPPPSGNEFNKGAATAALNGAAGAASGCKAPSDPAGVVRVSVTFAPSGRATRAVVNGAPYAGTATGSCVAAAFRSLSVPAFSGDPVTVSKSVSVH